jgi:hypothetical protein
MSNPPSTPPRVMRGADGTNAGAAGYVPAPGATENAKFLRGDATFAAVTNASSATNAQAIDGNNSTNFLTPANLAYARPPSHAPRGGIISTGAAAVGTTQDNTGLAFGTGDLSFGAWLRMPDWTPATTKHIASKLNAGVTLGVLWSVLSDGTVRVTLGNGAGVTSYVSTLATGLADGAWAHLALSLDRDGNAVFYVNGAQLGAAVAISALAAQTLTNTGALTWGSDGTNHTAGTLGETFIISGLLTATQVADIYRAGSIAPFAASFTFFQYVDFGQGYGPIIKDRSGQNQPALMSTSGLTHAVPRNPPGVPARAPRAALVFDGTSATKAFSTLGTQDPTTGDLAVLADLTIPSSISNTPGIWLLSSSSAPAGLVARSLYCYATSAGHLAFDLIGATTSDFRTLTISGLATLLAGERVVLAFTRTGTTKKVFLGCRGDWLDISGLVAETTGGSAPTWADTITGTYLVGGMRTSSGTTLTGAQLFDLRLANVAMTEAQLRTEYERGEPGPEWIGGNRAGVFTGDNTTFDSDTGYWNRGANATISGGVMNLNGAASTLYASGAPMKIGQWYKATVTIDTWTSGAALRLWGGGSVNYGEITKTTGATTTIVFQATSTEIGISNFSFAAVGGIATFTVEPLGYTSRLRTDTAAGLTALDGSSNKNDFLLSTTGVTTSPNGRTQTIRATTNTSGNQQLFGASVIDTTKRWRIRSWNINSSGTPTVSLGNVSAGAQYLSGAALTATNNEVTPLTRIPGTANLWCNANSTATLEHTVVLEQVD